MSGKVLPIAFLTGLMLLAACANRPGPIDEGEIARAALEEKAVQTAPVEKVQTAPPPEEDVPEIWAVNEFGLLHIPSGYICPHEAAGFKRIGEDVFPGLGTGMDVSCVYESRARARVKLHLTNFGRTVSAAAHLKGVETTIRDGHPGAKTAALPTGVALTRDAIIFQIPPSNALSDLGHNRTAAWISAYGLWHVKARATYIDDQTESVVALVDRLLVRAKETLPLAPQTSDERDAPEN